MRYASAQDILPAGLLEELQKYIDGAYLYVPRKQENRLAWGDRTRSKAETAARNQLIFQRFCQGETAAQLAGAFFLTEKTVRRIIAQERRARQAKNAQ